MDTTIKKIINNKTHSTKSFTQKYPQESDWVAHKLPKNIVKKTKISRLEKIILRYKRIVKVHFKYILMKNITKQK